MNRRMEPVKVLITSEGLLLIRQKVCGEQDSVVTLTPTIALTLSKDLKKAVSELKESSNREVAKAI